MIEYDQYRLKLESLLPELLELADALDIKGAAAELSELEKQSAVPGFWDDIKASGAAQKKMKQLSDKLAHYNKLRTRTSDAIALIEMAEEENDPSFIDEVVKECDEVTKEMAETTLLTLLSGEYDSQNAIMTFHAGAGGTEAQDWVQMLYRMYTHWAEQHSFKVKLLDFLDGEEAGIKSATVLIEGLNAFGFMKSEMGVHRLVRISPFDSSGRRHTSFASVEVMPEIDDTVEIDINPADLRVDTYRASGAGGQHVNKTESAIRITHIPTGVVVACQNERSQHQNREVAMRMLRSKLVEIKEREHLDRFEDIKGEEKEIGWGSQIRSYVFMPYTLAKDHRTGFEVGNINAVMDGDLDGFINAYLKMNARA